MSPPPTQGAFRMTRLQAIVVGGIACLLIALVAVVVLLPRAEDKVDDFSRGSGPGSVVSASDLDLPDNLGSDGATGREVTYRSTATDGKLVEVTAMMIEPAGKPPSGGWPVLALAHATTGIDPPCGPSHSPLRDPAIAGAAGWVEAGFVVTLTDYRGLSGKGDTATHPYLDNRAAGLDVIDSVRAARLVFPESSAQWVAFGHSQGGGAVWAANVLAETYAPELDLLGTAAGAPPINMVPAAQEAYDRQLNQDQMALLQYALESHARSAPSFDLDAFRSPRGAAAWDQLSGGCDGDTAQRSAAIAELEPGDIGPQDEAALAQLNELLQSYSASQEPTTAPLLVVYGAQDMLADPAWTEAAIAQARAVSDEIDVDLQPTAGHADVDFSSVIAWISAKAGVEAP